MSLGEREKVLKWAKELITELSETVRTRADMLEKVRVLYVKTGSLIKIK